MFLPRLSNKKWSLVFAVVSLVASVIALTGMKSYQPTNAYILQGASKGSMITLVNKIGGKVVHDFAVIPAISALLTDEQVSAIKKTNPLIRMFSDAKVQINSNSNEWQNSHPIRFKTDKKKAVWVAKNRTKETGFVDSVAIDWPVENGELKKLKVNGQLVAKKVTGQHITYYFDEPVEVKPGKKLKLTMKFDELQNVNDQDYRISFNLMSGETVAMNSVKEEVTRGENRDTYFPAQVNADQLHQVGITGRGVGVAVIDSGLDSFEQLEYNTYGEQRNIHRVSVIDVLEDEYGHGSHVTSLIANSSSTTTDEGYATLSYNGIAPDVDLISIKAFDGEGSSTYADILTAIDYVLQNKDELNIKVLNLSFGSEVQSLYNFDPINRALIKVWQEGITVVASAGNTGPDALTVGVPGNNPFIITVGATTDNYTPYNIGDDMLASFSSSGPTHAGFIKPEIVAPGAHMQGLVGQDSFLMQNYGMYGDEYSYFSMSGTSQATAVTTGIVALMLQEQPDLSPDDVKCRLMATARMAQTDDEELLYSIFRQGAGLVDAFAAVTSQYKGCANRNIDVEEQLANLDGFYIGPARYNKETQEYYLVHNEDYVWDGSTDQDMIDDFVASKGLIFNDREIPSRPKSKGLIFNDREIPSRPKSKGLIFNDREIPSRPKTKGLIFNDREIPSRPKTKGLIFNDREIPSRPKTSGLIFNDREIPSRPQTAGLIFNDREIPSRPTTAGLIFNDREIPSRPKTAGLIFNDREIPSRVSSIWVYQE